MGYLAAALLTAVMPGPAAQAAPFAYVTNQSAGTVSVIDTGTDTVIATVPVGTHPEGVAITPDGTRVYVTNEYSDNVSVISTATNTVIATVAVGTRPQGVAVTPDGTRVYVANLYSDDVSVISTGTNTVIATVTVGTTPEGVAVTPDGTRVYVANLNNNNVSVISTATNTVIATVTVQNQPAGVAVTPDGTRVYVANEGAGSVSVISTATNTVIATVFPVGSLPFGVAVTPDGTHVYVANLFSNTVAVISTATNTVIATVPVGTNPEGLAVHPDGTRVYVANINSDNVSVISTATNTVIATVAAGDGPFAFGLFITPAPSASPFRGLSPGISIGPDLGGTGQTALNVQGSAGSAGKTWIAVYDTNPSDPAENLFGDVSLSVDVMIIRFNNGKGAGLLALYNEGVGKKGLTLIVRDAGNADTLVLSTVDQAGTSTPLKSVSLSNNIAEKKWYRLTMDVSVVGGNVAVTGRVFRHTDPNNADSPVGAQVGATLNFSGPRPPGVDATGEVGIAAVAQFSVVDSSIANVTINGTNVGP
jgi:YVTN family beta-propeller protein